MKRALFLDRDGILNHIVERDSGLSSPRSLSELSLFEEALPLVKAAKRLGFLTHVVTNQPDIARGLLKQSELEAIHLKIFEFFGVDSIDACTSSDNSDPRRKPNPGMLLDAARNFDLDLSSSFFIGDSDKDILAGRSAGVRTILLETEYNKRIHGIGDFNVRSHDEVIKILEIG